MYYTTAKIALVGDSGVGKTGLGWVLTHTEGFREHPSTHGEQFWLADQLSKTRSDGTQCEAVVWDLAGQPDYRLIHSLFIDDADVALIVFDPTNRQDPLKGVEFWVRALRSSRREVCRLILVGARVDRGSGVFTDDELEIFVKEYGIEGGYVATSAMRGEGVDLLLERVTQLIDWDRRPATVTLDTFKDIKDHVLTIKELSAGHEGILVTPQELQTTLHDRTRRLYDPVDIATATKHLADHGYIRLLRNSVGEFYILLSPDLLNNLAASMVLEARRNPKSLGALDERRVLSGDYHFPELAPLQPTDREILLDAATTLFIEHNICFRESLGSDTFLIFPSLINQNKPQINDVPVIEATAYTATGATENVYATLVVLLGYTNTFTRTHQWRNQAQYEMGKGQICGFRLAEEREGQIDLILYFSKDSAPLTRTLFQGLFEKFLAARDVSVEAFPPTECGTCKYTQPRSEVIKRRRDGSQTMFCSNCGHAVILATTDEAKQSSQTELLDREQKIAANRTRFETALTTLKSFIRDTRDRESPSCFISYARGDEEHEQWIERNLATDLRNADIHVVLDRWHNPPGGSISRFVERIESTDFAILVGTQRMLTKYGAKDSDPIIAAELRLINSRLMKRESESERVVPLLREGDAISSFPPLVRDSVYLDFRNADRYFDRLFELLLKLYDIPFDHPAMLEPRDMIHKGKADA